MKQINIKLTQGNSHQLGTQVIQGNIEFYQYAIGNKNHEYYSRYYFKKANYVMESETQIVQ